MKIGALWTLVACGWLLACMPEPKHGSNDETSGEDGVTEASGGTGQGSTSTGSTGTGSTGHDGTGHGTTSPTGGDGSTTTGVPNACDTMGWAESYATYQAAAARAGGTYWYSQVTGGAGFESTCAYRTTVEVVEGTIIRRTFEVSDVPLGVDPTRCAEPYVEEAAEINTHEVGYDPPALLMEAQYEGCCELLAIEPADEYDVYFGVDDAGIARSCEASLANCADGCGVGVGDFYGFWFESFAFGPLP